MKPRSTVFIAGGTFLLGVALPALIIWNPGGWAWADRWVGRQPHATHVKSGQEAAKDSGASTAVSNGEKKERKIKYWRAPMDPNYIADKPGKSPMGMDLIPVYEDEVPAESGIRVDPNFLQNFAVRTALVEKGSIPVEIRTVGTIGYNEKNIVSVNTKFEGWIEKARVNYVAEPVKRGEVLFEIYSPQLVTTQQEYLAALEYVEKLSAGGVPEAVARARSLLESTRERLHYWDITEDQIGEMTKTKRFTRTLKILSPVSGVVIEKMGDSLEGMKLNAGMNVYKIADLSTVWAEIEVFEYQIQHLRLGQMAHVTLEAFPGRHWAGRVIYLDPALNQQTRTLKASVEIANPDRNLRPEMYADVLIRIPEKSEVVRVPPEAVLRSGQRNVVIVQKAAGLFEPREVELGDQGGGYQAIRRGLAAGETVVTSSQFLIDSESNLKEAISKMLAARQSDAGETAKPVAPPHQH
ncbi:MAG: efflux RND transporter periplasmic adaptor subunit [Acidobacteriota bacterium]